MRNESICLQKDCTGMFLTVLFAIAPKLQTVHMPFQRKMDKETWYIHIMRYLLSICNLQSGKTTEIRNNIDESQTFIVCKKTKHKKA